MASEGNETPCILVFVDEDSFNLGHNIISHRAMVDVPGQHGGNITMCAAISENGMATHILRLGPYNTQKLLIFLDRPHSDLIPENERGLVGPLPTKVCNCVEQCEFPPWPAIRAWFTTHPRMVKVFLPPCSPFLNRIEGEYTL